MESAIEAQFIKWCKANGYWTLKLTAIGYAGWPDRIVLLPNNRVVWIEFKTRTGVLSKVQGFIHRQMAKFGHSVSVCRSCSEAVNEVLRMSDQIISYDHANNPIRRGQLAYTPETCNPGGIGIQINTKDELTEGCRWFVDKSQMQAHLFDDYNEKWRKAQKA